MGTRQKMGHQNFHSFDRGGLGGLLTVHNSLLLMRSADSTPQSSEGLRGMRDATAIAALLTTDRGLTVHNLAKSA
jgi:hypothetical protein